jgi:hypothetical protein
MLATKDKIIAMTHDQKTAYLQKHSQDVTEYYKLAKPVILSNNPPPSYRYSNSQYQIFQEQAFDKQPQLTRDLDRRYQQIKSQPPYIEAIQHTYQHPTALQYTPLLI